jgi:GTP cyclohydrolase IA
VDTQTSNAQVARDEVVQAVRLLLQSIEPGTYHREGLKDTPKRVQRMYEEIFGGYTQEASDILQCTFTEGSEDYNGMVVLKDIPFYSTCEHHMVPFFGTIHIGYLPGESVVGLSKLARLVEMYARRLQIQERLTTQIADAIDGCLKPKGVIVVCEAEHLCMTMRGVQKPGAVTVTSSLKGVYETDGEARSEFFSLIRR